MSHNFAENLSVFFQQHANPERAEQMQAYMRGQFAFYGLSSATVKSLLAEYVQQEGFPAPENLPMVLRDLWDYDEREMQYVGTKLVRRLIEKQLASFIEILEDLITRKSWWDTVDALSLDAGTLFKTHPSLQPSTTNRWIDSKNIWLQRAAIIHQLMYKKDTDWEMLQTYILSTCHNSEFFIRKAAGWALRQ